MPHFQYRIEQQRDQKVNGRFKQNYRSTGPNRHMQNTRSTTAEYTFFSSVYVPFSKVDHTLVHKNSYCILKTGIVQIAFPITME